MGRPAHARIDLEALAHNVSLTRALAPTSQLMAVVKANAYGHGALPVAKALAPAVDAFAVACLEEALELRDAGIETPILLLEGVFSPDELAHAGQHNLWVTVADAQQLRWIHEASLDRPLTCWLKVDTGMHRLGVEPQAAAEFAQQLAASPNVGPDTVLYTHLACADEVGAALTQQQLAMFDKLPVDWPRSAANSAGVLAWPQSHYDWVRPGFMLYGNSPLVAEHPNALQLRPVMNLMSSITALRDVAAGETVGYGAGWTAQRPSRIATIAIGYGDGYPQGAPSGTPVLIRGRRVPLAGRVSMDMLTVDVTELHDVAVGDEVLLWGDGLPLAEIAQRTQCLGYELTTRMPARTPRVLANS